MNNEAAEIARQLSADERDALQDSGWNSRIYIDERDTTITVYDKLFLKGLLQRTIFDVQGERDVYYTILPLGRDVLAALQPDARPTTITAALVISDEAYIVSSGKGYFGKRHGYDLRIFIPANELETINGGEILSVTITRKQAALKAAEGAE